MSNVTELTQIKNKVSRNSFPLTSHRPFTAKAGELLPVYWRLAYPGDKWSLKHQHFTRTQPVNTAAFARFREYFDWYFVPLRLLNKSIGQALVQMVDNPVQATSLLSNKDVITDIPFVPLYNDNDNAWSLALVLESMTGTSVGSNTYPIVQNAFGFQASALSMKLLRYLGYGNILGPTDTTRDLKYTSAPRSVFAMNAAANPNVHILPLLAYQKIYNDYFRFSQWENSEPFTWNVDYYTGGNILNTLNNFNGMKTFITNNNFMTLRYCNWNKDQFTGVMPNQQLGDISSVNIGANIVSLNPSDVYYHTGVGVNEKEYSVVGQGIEMAGQSKTQIGLLIETSAAAGTFGSLQSKPTTASFSGGEFDIIQLRMAEALQRFREIQQCNDQDYVSQIEAIWNVRLSKALSDQCIWIGGSASNLNISEVENNNLSDSQSILKGKGIGSGQSSETFSFSEHGILMCIYHCMPLIDYTITGQNPELLMTSIEDFPNPVFDRIGLETESFLEFVNMPLSKGSESAQSSAFFSPMGYLPRFYSAKLDVDRVLGAFETTLQSWVVTLSPSYLSDWLNNSLDWSLNGGVFTLNSSFFKVNPSVCDSIFAVKADSTVDTDQFLVDVYFDVKSVRNFDYDGMPY